MKGKLNEGIKQSEITTAGLAKAFMSKQVTSQQSWLEPTQSAKVQCTNCEKEIVINKHAINDRQIKMVRRHDQSIQLIKQNCTVHRSSSRPSRWTAVVIDGIRAHALMMDSPEKGGSVIRESRLENWRWPSCHCQGSTGREPSCHIEQPRKTQFRVVHKNNTRP